jgi:hypothetical protein
VAFGVGRRESDSAQAGQRVQLAGCSTNSKNKGGEHHEIRETRNRECGRRSDHSSGEREDESAARSRHSVENNRQRV